MSSATASEIDARWPAATEPVLDTALPDGGRLTVSCHPAAGYLLRSEVFGAFMVSPDGTSIRVCPTALEPWKWQRMLVGQVLPLAALLRGFEVLHCSGVVLDGRAALFTGGSGVGKTSLALHLLGEGAAFLTDDVAALRTVDGAPVAEPGPGLASVDARELARAPNEVAYEVVGRYADEVRVALPVIGTGVPVGTLVFLRPAAGRGGLDLRRIERPEPGLLLAASFNWFVNTPERAAHQLEVAAALAARAEVYEATVFEDTSAEDMAARVAPLLSPG